MIKKISTYYLFLLLLPLAAAAQHIDTAGMLKRVKNDLAAARSLSHDYTVDAKFPNGNKDQMTGTGYLDVEDKLLYNSSNAFTAIYTGRWFYKADHKNKTVSVIDLGRQKDRKMNSAREKAIFKNDAFDAFSDTVLMKTAAIRQLKYEGNVYHITIGFAASAAMKTIDVAYDTLSRLPVSTATVMWQPLQMTDKGMQSVVVNIDCRNFKKVTDKSLYNPNSYFSYVNRKVELKKYTNYKLTSKI